MLGARSIEVDQKLEFLFAKQDDGRLEGVCGVRRKTTLSRRLALKTRMNASEAWYVTMLHVLSHTVAVSSYHTRTSKFTRDARRVAAVAIIEMESPMISIVSSSRGKLLSSRPTMIAVAVVLSMDPHLPLVLGARMNEPAWSSRLCTDTSNGNPSSPPSSPLGGLSSNRGRGAKQIA